MPQNENLQSLLDLQQNELSALASVSDSIDSRNLGILAANIAALIFIGQAGYALAAWQYVLLLTPYFVLDTYFASKIPR